MTTRRRFRALALLLLVVLACIGAGPARAEDITGTVQRVGWWTKRLGAQPTVPAGSFEVALGTDKAATSVAAIDIAVPVQPVQTLQISLTELTGTASQIAHIQVCLAAPGWTTANAGAFDEAPAIDCTMGVADLTRSLDGNWLGDIGGLLPNGGTASLGILLVDDLAAPISPGATVQIAGITITGQSLDGAVPADTTTTGPPAGGTDGSIVEPSVGFVPPPTDAFDLPPLDTGLDGDAPATSTTTTTTLATTPDEISAPAFATDATPWWRVVILTPVAVALGFGAVLTRRLLEARGFTFG
jgi:hypothetical protein